MKSPVTEAGYDDERAWNDDHIHFVMMWLIKNEASPFYKSRIMIIVAMGFSRGPQTANLAADIVKRNLGRYRFSTRLSLTRGFKRILAGDVLPKDVVRTKAGVVRSFSIVKVANPQPLPCPPWHRGTISLTKDGIKLQLKRSDAMLAPKHDPAGRERLLNAFGKRGV
jgi:hypothetical protein